MQDALGVRFERFSELIAAVRSAHTTATARKLELHAFLNDPKRCRLLTAASAAAAAAAAGRAEPLRCTEAEVERLYVEGKVSLFPFPFLFHTNSIYDSFFFFRCCGCRRVVIR
jgi:hypothetical protein